FFFFLLTSARLLVSSSLLLFTVIFPLNNSTIHTTKTHTSPHIHNTTSLHARLSGLCLVPSRAAWRQLSVKF
ncbi:hypothetical protein LEMLEM_LOCUS20460, partial [Lemmus lemmus]